MTYLVVQHALQLGSLSDRISDELAVSLGAVRFPEPCVVTFTGDDGLLGEFPGIRRVWEAAHADEPPSYIGYWHTKGATHPDDPAIADWRRYMMYFFLRGPSTQHDLTGVNWTEDPQKGKWFAGNFWWASSEHIRKLPEPKPDRDRMIWEFWVGQGEPTVLNRFTSGVNHYHTRYRPFRYLGKGL